MHLKLIININHSSMQIKKIDDDKNIKKTQITDHKIYDKKNINEIKDKQINPLDLI